MSGSIGSVTRLIRRLESGSEAAAAELWRRFAKVLTQVARKQLSGASQRFLTAEDAVESGFGMFLIDAFNSKTRGVKNRKELWALLQTIVQRKAKKYVRFERQQKRNNRRLERSTEEDDPLDRLAGNSKPPDWIVAERDEVQKLLAVLGQSNLQAIVGWKVDGWTNREIAERLGRTERTVERKLELIRKFWQARRRT